MIEILFASNRRFLSGTALTIGSLIWNYHGTEPLRFNLISSDLQPHDLLSLESYLNSIAGSSGQFLLNYIEGEKILRRGSELLPRSKHFSAEANARLFIFELFPEAEKVYYFDTDLMFNINPAEIFNFPLDEQPLGACQGLGNYLFRDFSQSRPDLPIPEEVMDLPYFNSGVLVFDLNRGREAGFEAHLWDILDDEDCRLANSDQYILNRVFAGEWKILPRRFNERVFLNRGQDVDPNLPAVFHFVGSEKPWDRSGNERILRYAQRFLTRTHWSRFSPPDCPSLPSPSIWRGGLYRIRRLWKWMRNRIC